MKISEDDIINFEKKYGRIEEASFVAFYTGWSQYWNNPKQYHNNHVFPGLSELAANLLVSKKVVGIGVDTLSPDLPISGFRVHNIILGANKYIVENVANLEKMPKISAYVLILLIKGSGLTEASVKMVGIINNDY
jgi:kynurenine formamidase